MIKQFKSDVPEKPLMLPIYTRMLRDGTIVPYPTLTVLKIVIRSYIDMLDESLAASMLGMPEENIEQVHLDTLKDALVGMLSNATVAPSV